VLILWGDQDGLFDAVSQERLRTALPAARFETFEGYGHNMFWETPEGVAGILTDFLQP
jgi:pimeloyl-ACP methyl ester carboxylesterase